jgi:predicted negative regulator of RcsB-dependent stress response
VAFDSDKEQLDAFKIWWKENGRVVVTGLVLGLGGVFGWTTWQNYTTKQAESASLLYEEIVNWAAARNYGRVDELTETLLLEFPNSGYAPMSALIRAQSAVAQDKADEAQGYLRWVVDNGDVEYLKIVANLRLAQLAVEKQDNDAALGFLDAVEPGPLSTLYEELRADIYVIEGDAEKALKHYDKALKGERVTAASRSRVEMKSADLGLGPRASVTGE